MDAQDLIRDLADALADPDGQEDPVGVLLAWAAVARGDVTPADRFWPSELTPRQRVAMGLAETGPVTSGALALATGVSREAARLDLVALAGKGLLRVQGSTKGRRYVL